MLRLVLTSPFLRLALAAVGLAAALPACASLAWEAQEQRFKVAADQSTARIRFAFTNTGEQPVTVTEIHAGCSCASATTPKTTYAPGERGEIVVDFRRGNREGDYRQDISVATDDGAVAVLSFVAEIESLVQFDTRYVFWAANEPRTPKHMRLTFATGHQARMNAVVTNDPQFAVSFAPKDAMAREFDLTITPPPAASTFAILTIRFQLDGSPEVRELVAVTRTLPPKNEPAKTDDDRRSK